MNARLYRLQQINEIERELHLRETQTTINNPKYHCIINFCDACFLIVQFCMFLLNVGFLSNFQEIKVKFLQ